MGFNTVVLLINDHSHILEKAPYALTFAICHPPHSYEKLDIDSWWVQVQLVAKDHGENIHRSYFEVMPTFHADDKHILFAGWNQLIRPTEFTKITKVKENTYITAKAPEWWSR